MFSEHTGRYKRLVIVQYETYIWPGAKDGIKINSKSDMADDVKGRALVQLHHVDGPRQSSLIF